MSEFDPVSLLQPAATRVRDPVSGRSVWLAGMVRDPHVHDGALEFGLVFGADHSAADRAAIQEALAQNLKGLGFGGVVRPKPQGEAPRAAAPVEAPVVKPPPPAGAVPGMNLKGAMQPHGGAIVKKRIEGVTHIIAVASGKGGVGKSTVSANLAVALRRLGHGVGLLDLDVHGPSVPTMLGVHARPLIDGNQKIVPVSSYGVRCMSMGLLVDAQEAMIWRGPMVMGALRQFIQDVSWAGCDYLIVDTPPGTGDAHLSLIQAVDLAGAIVVSTPQEVALADAVRGINMFRKLGVPLLGVVENMAWYSLPDGTRDYVFGEGGAVRVAAQYETEVLGQIPLQTALRRSGDQGLPAALGDDALGQSFMELARKVAAKLPVEARESV